MEDLRKFEPALQKIVRSSVHYLHCGQGAYCSMNALSVCSDNAREVVRSDASEGKARVVSVSRVGVVVILVEKSSGYPH
jgi:hypothetical protein